MNKMNQKPILVYIHSKRAKERPLLIELQDVISLLEVDSSKLISWVKHIDLVYKKYDAIIIESPGMPSLLFAIIAKLRKKKFFVA